MQDAQNAQKYDQVKTCPLQKPFSSDGSVCINCEGNTPYFNIDTQQCSNCDSYDSSVNVCNDKIPVLTPVIDDATSKYIIVPDDKTIEDYKKDVQ